MKRGRVVDISDLLERSAGALKYSVSSPCMIPYNVRVSFVLEVTTWVTFSGNAY